VLRIRESEIDHELARGSESPEEGATQGKPEPVGRLLRNRTLLVFLVSCALFHLGNAAMLPLVGQVLAEARPQIATLCISVCIILAQLIMIAVAAAVGRAMRAGYGRKTIFLLGFAVLPVRGLLYTFSHNALWLVGVQALDGIGAGIFGVIAVVIAADLTRGTGRFNLAQGMVALCAGLGAGLSNLFDGFIVERFGDNAGFLFLAACALCALTFFALLMPETQPANHAAEATARNHAPDVAA